MDSTGRDRIGGSPNWGGRLAFWFPTPEAAPRRIALVSVRLARQPDVQRQPRTPRASAPDLYVRHLKACRPRLRSISGPWQRRRGPRHLRHAAAPCGYRSRYPANGTFHRSRASKEGIDRADHRRDHCRRLCDGDRRCADSGRTGRCSLRRCDVRADDPSRHRARCRGIRCHGDSTPHSRLGPCRSC